MDCVKHLGGTYWYRNGYDDLLSWCDSWSFRTFICRSINAGVSVKFCTGCPRSVNLSLSLQQPRHLSILGQHNFVFFIKCYHSGSNDDPGASKELSIKHL